MAPGTVVASGPLLEIRGLVKSFGGPNVLDGVDFDVQAGEVHALLGANGAGKSTLIKIISGLHPHDGGTVSVLGAEGATGGVAFVHQDLGLIETATVAENIAMTDGFPRRLGLIAWGRLRDRAREVLAMVGADISPDATVASLGRTDRSLIAIARAVATDPSILVLDEPTASLPAADVEVLFSVIRRLKERGVGIIYVSHRLDEVFAISDRTTVLRDGRVAGCHGTDSMTMSQLVRMIVGADLQALDEPPDLAPDRDERLSVSNLVAAGIGPVTLTLGRGEIVGLAGLRGSGQEEIGRAIGGALPRRSGEVRVDGQPVATSSPIAARSAGISFATSRREEESVASTLTVGENAILNPGLTGRRNWQLRTPRSERAEARQIIDRFGVFPPEPERPILTLSGGNQQKIVIGREMHARPKVLVLEEPTMGVDVRSKAEIYRLLGEAAAQGCSVLVVSTDPDDITAICHRALIMRRGRVVGEIGRADLTVANLVQAVGGDTTTTATATNTTEDPAHATGK
jgi:ribose transport system ATP-binding protein